MALPSARVALRLQQFMNKAGVENVRCHDLNAMGVFAVTFKSSTFPIAKLFWYVFPLSTVIVNTKTHSKNK